MGQNPTATSLDSRYHLSGADAHYQVAVAIGVVFAGNPAFGVRAAIHDLLNSNGNVFAGDWEHKRLANEELSVMFRYVYSPP